MPHLQARAMGQWIEDAHPVVHSVDYGAVERAVLKGMLKEQTRIPAESLLSEGPAAWSFSKVHPDLPEDHPTATLWKVYRRLLSFQGIENDESRVQRIKVYVAMARLLLTDLGKVVKNSKTPYYIPLDCWPRLMRPENYEAAFDKLNGELKELLGTSPPVTSDCTGQLLLIFFLYEWISHPMVCDFHTDYERDYFDAVIRRWRVVEENPMDEPPANARVPSLDQRLFPL